MNNFKNIEPRRGDLLNLWQIHTHKFIFKLFSLSKVDNLISKKNREELHKFITGIVSNRNQKLFAVFAMPDHVHILVSMSPVISISDLVRDIKAGSSKFINEKIWMNGNLIGR